MLFLKLEFGTNEIDDIVPMNNDLDSTALGGNKEGKLRDRRRGWSNRRDSAENVNKRHSN